MHTVKGRLFATLLLMVGTISLATLVLAGFQGQLPSLASISAHAAGSNTPVSYMTLEGEQELQSFHKWITVMEQAHEDATLYQKQYKSDQQAMAHAPTRASYQAALSTLKTHTTDIQMPALKAQATDLRQQLQQKTTAWGQQHPHLNKYDGVTYSMGYEYGEAGADWAIAQDLDAAKTTDDYQAIVTTLHTDLDLFDTMTTNAADTTTADSVHKTDTELLDRYKLTTQKVVVVSLQEQALRVYQNGQMVNSFLVTTGRYSHPSLPGIWQVQVKLSPTTFKSGAPVGSPDWYADTHINYAMQYHEQGYFLHDSWWRANYGPDTQFPHMDATGNQSASTGSHGCVNMTTKNAGWLYDFIDKDTSIVIY